MNNRQPSSVKFAVISAIAILGTTAALVSLWPPTLAAARHESAMLVAEGQKASGGEAETDFRLAAWLDSNNPSAFTGLARTQIAAGNPDAALVSLTKAGEGSDVEQLKIRTMLELGRYSDAANASSALTAPGHSDTDLLLAGLAYDLDQQPGSASALIPRITSPEAASSLARAQTTEAALADELYATGLLKSSSAILAKLPSSYNTNLLRARIFTAQHSNPTQAISYLTTANSINPANVDARLLLAKIYRSQNQIAKATEQEDLVHQLQTGRP